MKLMTIALLSVLLCSCSATKQTESKSANMPSPPVYIYKTKAEYRLNVPILLSDDKQTIVSYPHPSDVTIQGTLCLPEILKDGFYLDMKGINKNAAFLNITYAQYAKLENPPSIEELTRMILDKDPFVVLYQCGTRMQYKNIIDELNAKIQKKQFSEFKQLK